MYGHCYSKLYGKCSACTCSRYQAFPPPSPSEGLGTRLCSAALSCRKMGGAIICILRWNSMHIATENCYTVKLHNYSMITTSLAVITSTHHNSLCIQPQVCSTVNTAVVTALCIYPLHAVMVAVFRVHVRC